MRCQYTLKIIRPFCQGAPRWAPHTHPSSDGSTRGAAWAGSLSGHRFQPAVLRVESRWLEERRRERLWRQWCRRRRQEGRLSRGRPQPIPQSRFVRRVLSLHPAVLASRQSLLLRSHRRLRPAGGRRGGLTAGAGVDVITFGTKLVWYKHRGIFPGSV